MAARTTEAHVGHELGNVLLGVDANVLYAQDLGQTALKSLDDKQENLRDLLVELNTAHADAALSVRRLKDMIERLKTGDGSQAPKARCYMDRVVDSTVRILRKELQKVARLQAIIEATPCVPMDASLLGQVAANLLLNAAQAMQGMRPNKGAIAIKVATVEGRAVLSVSDNGKGIANEHLDRIFDAHFTTKETGKGIGLAIVREIVREAGGEVTVETGSSGTTFFVTLPIVESASVRPSSQPPNVQ
jgi:signal transduction histidine kinase